MRSRHIPSDSLRSPEELCHRETPTDSGGGGTNTVDTAVDTWTWRARSDQSCSITELLVAVLSDFQLPVPGSTQKWVIGAEKKCSAPSMNHWSEHDATKWAKTWHIRGGARQAMTSEQRRSKLWTLNLRLETYTLNWWCCWVWLLSDNKPVEQCVLHRLHCLSAAGEPLVPMHQRWITITCWNINVWMYFQGFYTNNMTEGQRRWHEGQSQVEDGLD